MTTGKRKDPSGCDLEGWIALFLDGTNRCESNMSNRHRGYLQHSGNDADCILTSG